MSMAVPSNTTSNASTGGERKFSGKDKPTEVRLSNITAGRAVADVIRTSLGPRGMDKMIKTAKGEVLITNDGATILKHMAVLHPCSKMLVELSAAQDAAAGDGTTSVVVIAGALLGAAERLLERGVHPTAIADAFKQAAGKAEEVLQEVAQPLKLDDRDALLRSAATSLNSKIVAPYSAQVSAVAVDAVLAVAQLKEGGGDADLAHIRIVPKAGGTIEDMQLCEGVVLTQGASRAAGGPTRMEKARIALCQFQLSPPKTDMESQIVVTEYAQMDRILREERAYILSMCKKIKKTGANVLLVQKSILREGVSELALHYLAKLKIMVVNGIEREEVEFLARSLGCRPIADIEAFTEERLGTADLVEEASLESGGQYLHVTGIRTSTTGSAPAPLLPRRTVSILCRGANEQVLAEAERSLHDALCVLRCLVRRPALICGGGAPETQLAVRLSAWAKSLPGQAALACEAYAEAFLTVPTVLAENAGLEPIAMVTELRKRHAEGAASAGINVRRAVISDMAEEGVVQPLLVSLSAVLLATETVCMLLKIDDIVQSR